MNIFYKILLITFLNVILLQKTYPQEEKIKFQRIGIEHGLSQHTITCIHQDSRGFMWFGTIDGLNRYDGYNFKIYRTNINDPSSISSNTINYIYEDKEGNLWIGTTGGVNKFDIKTEKFTHFKHNPLNPHSISQNLVYKIFEDNRDNLWTVTNDAISLLDRKTGNFENFKYDTIPLVGETQDVYPTIIDHAGNFWIGTHKGIRIFNPKIKQFNSLQGELNAINGYLLYGEIIYSIFQDKYGRFWFGTDKGLYHYDLVYHIIFHYEYNSKNLTGFSGHPVHAIYEDSYNRLWIGTWGGGLAILNREYNTLSYFTYDKDDPYSISNNFIFSIYEDNTRTLWIGTQGRGINKVDPKAQKFLHYNAVPSKKDLISNDIFAILQDNKENLWIGTRGNGLICQYKHIEQYVVYLHQPDNPNSIISNNVTALLLEKDNYLWIGTDKGLTRLDISKNIFTHFLSVCDYKVRAIYEDHKGYLWIGTENGLIRLNRETKEFEKFIYSSKDPFSLSQDRVFAIKEDAKHNLWIATYGGGINKFDPNTGKFIRFKHDKNNPYSIISDDVLSLLITDDSTLWVGTSCGLCKFNMNTNKAKCYSTNDGLANDFIYAILSDNLGDIWVSTNRGLSKFTPQTEKFINYDIKDGLQDYEFNVNAAFKNKKGELFFGGINGFNSYFPDSIYKNPYVPPVVLTSFKLYPYAETDIKLDTPITEKKSLTLSYKDIFTLEFSALNYTLSEKNNYAYKLEGFDKDWIYCGTQNSVTYQKLKPGEYLFRVKGSNNDLVWNEEGTYIHLTITPPFYATLWFRILVIVVGLSLIYLIIYFITRASRRKIKILEEKQVIAEELAKRNKDITDSLNYAKRIQASIMPTENKVKQLFPQSFILFFPKEIVSGDFYWVYEKDGLIYCAGVDCTGHGVPGAFMSIVGNSLLNQAVVEHKLTKPSEILSDINDGIIKTFQTAEESTVKDGMDIALCCFNFQENKMQFAGAYNPICIVRNNELLQFKGNRYPIGLFNNNEINGFTNNEFTFQKGDMIYIFSDGFADQFGGNEGKKFKYYRFKKLILDIHNLSMDEQKEKLIKTFYSWKGEQEQIDDVLIIGIRI